MGNSKSFQGYEDVVKIFEYAFTTGTAIAFDAPTEGQAIKFLTRAGSYRRMIRREQGHCAFDTLRLSRSGRTITITRWVDTIPQLYDPRTGAPITLIDTPTPYELMLQYEAEHGPPKRYYDANAAGHHQLPDDWSSPEPGAANEPYQKPVDNYKK